MGLFDWLGPTSLSKRRGWDALPSAIEQKAAPTPRTITLYDSQLQFMPTAAFSSATALTTTSAATNSAVFACLQAIATAIAEPELKVYRLAPGERIELEDTPLGALLHRPNPYFSMDALLAYLSTSLHVSGDAYWRKLRAGNPESGNVVELWPIAPSAIEPVTVSGSGDFISYYRYRPDGQSEQRLSPANVIHFRYGLDDADHRRGLAPLKRLLREVSSDEQATRYADRLLANLAINGLTLTWDKDANEGRVLTQAQADEMKARIQAAYGGDNAGSVAVLSPGASLTALGFSPEQMDLRVLHQVPEERISAVLGVPAATVGLGAGLEHSIYNNVRQAEEHFTERKLIPLWRAIAAELTLHLVPDFASDASVVVDFDIADVRALADDENAEATRLQTLVTAGIITKDEARAELGLEPLPESEAPAAQPPPVPIALPAAASRRLVRTLPDSSPQMRARNANRSVQTKSADTLVQRIEADREQRYAEWLIAIGIFLEAQSRRAAARLRRGEDDLVPADEEQAQLEEALAPLQAAVLAATAALVQAELEVAIALDDAAQVDYEAEVIANIASITETTRAAVDLAVAEGTAASEGAEQLALRIRRLPAFAAGRAQLIASSELAHSSQSATIQSYRASGIVVGVKVHDGHDFDTPCAEMDGRVFALDELPPSTEHPHCQRLFSPILSGEAIAQSA